MTCSSRASTASAAGACACASTPTAACGCGCGGDPEVHSLDLRASKEHVVVSADYVWMNGEFVAFEDAKVPVLTHALHYGTGVFEGVRAYETPRGTAVFRHKEH